MTITIEEEKIIKSLKRLAKKWPKSLWLFSASGTLCVMKCNKKGEQAMNQPSYPGELNLGVDQEYVIDTIKIPNDGGDW